MLCQLWVNLEIIEVHESLHEEEHAHNALLNKSEALDRWSTTVLWTLDSIDHAREGIDQSISHIMNVFSIVSLHCGCVGAQTNLSGLDQKSH